MIIYQIKNKINGKSYIGQTVQALEERIQDHFSGHGNAKALCAAIKKYGKENFEVFVIDTGLDIDDLNKKECFYIVNLNSMFPSGYNLRPGGNNAPISENQKIAISKKLMGRKRTVESIKKQMITRKQKNIKPPTLGLKFNADIKEKKKQELLLRISQGRHPSLGVKHSDQSKINMAVSKGAKTFWVFSTDGNLIGEWINQTQCAKTLNIARSYLVKCLHGHSNHKKFIFKFKE